MNTILSNKKIIAEFENEFASYIGTNHAIGTSMGRTALIALLSAIGIKEGDEVILPAFICEVVPNAILKLKGVPKFVDINSYNYHISFSHFKSLMTEKTKAVLIDHIFGYPEDIDAIKGIIKSYNDKIYLIEDATHALGARYKGQKVGSLGDAAIFSFTKNMVNLGGGAITTNDYNIARRVKSSIINSNASPIHIKLFFGALSYLDIKKVNSHFFNTAQRMLDNLPKYSKFLTSSYNDSLKIPENLSISPMQAFIASKGIMRIDHLNNQRNKNQFLLDSLLKDASSIHLLSPNENTQHASTYYVIETKNQNIKNKLMNDCKKMGVYLSELWNPLPVEQYPQILQNLGELSNSINKARLILVFKMDPFFSNNDLIKMANTILTSLA